MLSLSHKHINESWPRMFGWLKIHSAHRHMNFNLGFGGVFLLLLLLIINNNQLLLSAYLLVPLKQSCKR